MGIDILTLAAARAGKGGGSASKYKQPEWGAEGEKIILPENTYEIDADSGMSFIAQEFAISDGAEYIVNYNGTEYNCVAIDTGEAEGIALGNIAGAMGTGNTGEPFLVLAAHDEEAGFYGAILPLDGSTSCTVSIRSNIIHKIPAEYVEPSTNEPLIVRWKNNSGAVDVFTEDFDTVYTAIKNGRTVYFCSDNNTENTGYLIPLSYATRNEIVFTDIVVWEDSAHFTKYVLNDNSDKMTKTTLVISAN